MRIISRKFGRELHCHRNTVNRMVNPTTSVFRQLQTFSREEKVALLVWLTQQGPFWEDIPEHDPNEWFECNGELVNDTALAEVAYCSMTGIERAVVSLIPSEWDFSPITVTKGEVDTRNDIEISNFRQPSDLESALQVVEPPISTWVELEAVSRHRFQRLTFAEDSFKDLDGRPFSVSAVNGIVSRLDLLNRFVESLSGVGRWTPESRKLYENHFTGKRAVFSDSSDPEKRDFRSQLTFRHPTQPDKYLFCTWHGKVSRDLLRVHFSWPVSDDGRLYVVYVGRKITTR